MMHQMIVTVGTDNHNIGPIWYVRRSTGHGVTIYTYYSFRSVCDQIIAWSGPVRFHAAKRKAAAR
jgi:hypothetical protein